MTGSPEARAGVATTSPLSAANAGWPRAEIDCTAEWFSAGGSWRWRGSAIAIRPLTDGVRGQTRVASARGGVLPNAVNRSDPVRRGSSRSLAAGQRDGLGTDLPQDLGHRRDAGALAGGERQRLRRAGQPVR